jgi:hypothetical protein
MARMNWQTIIITIVTTAILITTLQVAIAQQQQPQLKS